MMSSLKIILLLIIFFNALPVSASIRIDLEGRTAEEVVRNALKLGNGPLGKSTGAILIINEEDGIDFGTGVIIDPYTVLTVAHLRYLNKATSIHFILEKNPLQYSSNNVLKARLSVKHHIHPTFSRLLSPQKIPLYQENGEFYLEERLLSDYASMSFKQFDETGFIKQHNFSGVDLAILKLEEPILEDYPFSYPKFIDAEYIIPQDTYGISLGFGTLKYNDQARGPIAINIDDNDPHVRGYQRHLISCKVSPETSDEKSLLCGSYTTLLINGDESFIPKNDMLKTEGLPTSGSSGGPLFIKVNDEYRLAGVLSGTIALLQEVCIDATIRNKLAGYKMPVFPTWTDLRPYQEWIKSHMGPLQNQ